MSHILVGFSTKHNSFVSRSICTLTDFWASHCVLVNTDRTRIIESTGIPFTDCDTGEMRDGVRALSFDAFMQRDLAVVRKISHPDPDLVWQYAMEMVDKKLPYDHESLGAWLLRRGDGDEHKINCREVITVNTARAGWPVLPVDVPRTTPRDLYLISEAL